MIEVVKNSNKDQPYHVRIRSTGNNKTLVWGEPLSNEQDALDEVLAVAREFGLTGLSVSIWGGYYAIWNDRTFIAQIAFVDEVEGTTSV